MNGSQEKMKHIEPFYWQSSKMGSVYSNHVKLLLRTYMKAFWRGRRQWSDAIEIERSTPSSVEAFGFKWLAGFTDLLHEYGFSPTAENFQKIQQWATEIIEQWDV